MSAIVLDCETTGFDPEKDRIIELAIVIFETGDVIFHSYFQPRREDGSRMAVPQEIIELTGITNSMLDDAPMFNDKTPDICRIIGEAEAVLGYNIKFDQNFIDAQLELAPMTERYQVAWPLLVCGKRTWEINEPRNLTNAYRRFVDPDGFKGAHGAVADTHACRETMLAQKKEYTLPDDWRKWDPATERQWGKSDHFQWKDLRLTCCFGKNKGKPVGEIDKSFWNWLLKKDFPKHVADLAKFCLDAGDDDREHRIHTWAKAYV